MSDCAPPLSDRARVILRAVCRDYIVTGGPVSSSALVRRHGFRWSSATLRQELATLEQAGLLSRVHRSAGCCPTQAGLQQYVGELPTDGPVGPHVRQAVESTLWQMPDPGRGMRAGACVLAEVSGCLAVTFLGTATPDEIREVDVVPLVGTRALVVLTLAGDQTRIQPVELAADAEDLQPADFDTLRAQLRHLCRGRTLTDAREALLQRLGEHEARLDHAVAQALRIGLLVCTADAMDPLWMEVAGQPVLAARVADSQRLGELLSLLEDDQQLAQVLCQLLPEPLELESMRAQVRVGADGLLRPTDEPGPPGLSLVGCRLPVSASDGTPAKRGAVVLLGPDRMDYAAVIPLVEYAARALAARVGA
jgi:heat-inducible transcriptional repressor